MARLTKEPKPALELIEDAVDVLRSAPLHFLLPYYLGSLPFCLAFLFFVTDMRSAFAEHHLVPSALGLSVLFVGMKLAQSLFALRIYDRAAHTDKSRFTVKSLPARLSFQAAVHASGFIVLPLALLATIPYVYVAAFYQNALVLGPEEGDERGAAAGRLRKAASFAPRQNHVIYLVFLAVRLGMLLNIGLSVYTLPQLMKSLFGVESMFSRGGFSVMNSTYIVTVLVLTYLTTDPLFKAVHALRCFYAQAEKTGEDLRAELLSLARNLAVPGFLAFFVILSFVLGPSTLTAAQKSPVKSAVSVDTGVSPEALDQSITHVIEGREFAWRMKRDKASEKKEDGPLDGVIAWVKPYVKKVTDTLSRWFKAFSAWLKKIMPEPKVPVPKTEKQGKPLVRYLLYGLLALTVCLFAFFIIRIVLAGRRESMETVSGKASAPDLDDAGTRADDLPPSAWRDLARQLMEKGEYRWALRALYFETLALLSEKGFLSIAAYKSNREYQKELAMKAHEKADLVDLFKTSVTLVDRAWYGNLALQREDVADFAAWQERIMAHAR
jgi:hypothetical protein